MSTEAKYTMPLMEALKAVLKEKGYTLEIVIYDDYV